MIRRIALLLMLWPASLAADNLSEAYTQDDLVLFDRDALLAGWVMRDSPQGTKLMAGAVASIVSANLDSAMLQIDCVRQPAPAHLHVGLHYWLVGRPRQENGYMMDLFSDPHNLRPSAYDLGQGAVATADIQHQISSDGPPQADYFAAMDRFLTPLAQGEVPQIVISFTKRGSSDRPGEAFHMAFPTYRLRAAAVMLQRDCPPMP